MNFGGYECTSDYNNSKIVVLPVPYDATSTWIKGADRGPEAILGASPNLEFFDIETWCDIRPLGIFTLPGVSGHSSPDEMVGEVKKQVSGLFDEGKFPVVIGGNHSVSIGAIYAAAGKFDDITVLQLDAHTDLRESYEGSELNHGCVMARAREVAPVVQVGIRSMSGEEALVIDTGNVFYAKDILSDPGQYSQVIERLSGNIYVTIDLDVLDPSEMPSTGTPEPGGLSYHGITGFLKEVSERSTIVGFDVVELCPSEYNKAPDFLAAKLIYQLLSYIFRYQTDGK